MHDQIYAARLMLVMCALRSNCHRLLSPSQEERDWFDSGFNAIEMLVRIKPGKPRKNQRRLDEARAILLNLYVHYLAHRRLGL